MKQICSVLAGYVWDKSNPYVAQPERALPSANRLTKLAPNAGHLTHMPAHIYARTGDIPAAAIVAVALRALLAACSPWSFGYVWDLYHEAIQRLYATGHLPASTDCSVRSAKS